MKQIVTKVHNIQKDILGKITFSKHLLHLDDYIYVKSNLKKGIKGYASVITDSEDVSGDYPVVGGVSDLSIFKEGDVVFITPEGLVSFLYEIDVKSNALFVTERCNHRCIMCPQPPVTQEVNKMPLNMRLLSLMDKDTREIGITGGEPTLIGDDLFVLIKEIKKRMPRAAVNLLSNGVKFANKDYAKKLALCLHPDLQIDVPIFSDVPSEHNRIVGAKTFYKTVEGLYNLALFHQRVGLRIVVHKQTYRRLPQLAEYIYRNFPFVSQVAFLQMETIGIQDADLPSLWIDPYDYNEQLSQAISILSLRGIKTYIYNAQLCVLPPELREYSVKSISDWKDAFIEECSDCSLRDACGGVFSTNKNNLSKYIKKQG